MLYPLLLMCGWQRRLGEEEKFLGEVSKDTRGKGEKKKKNEGICWLT